MGLDHQPVLLEAVLENLVVSLSGLYIDATFGRGGHTRALLARLDQNARVYGMDRDPDAVAVGQSLMREDPRFVMVHECYANIDQAIAERGCADGILMDIGVSSPQLDVAERGFSFDRDGPLDMRMNPGAGQSAAQWLNEAPESEISRVISTYGEERYARRIARAIITARPLTRTAELAAIIATAVPRNPRVRRHPATKTFQAIRMQVNDELGELDAGLTGALTLLKVGGRLAVITFHSLEDRMVKQRFKEWTNPSLPRRLPVRDVQTKRSARAVAGAVRASNKEVEANPRARSATLRVIEKVAVDEHG